MTQATTSLQATITLLMLSAVCLSRCYAVPIPDLDPTQTSTLQTSISPTLAPPSPSSCSVTPDSTVIHDSTCIQEVFQDAAEKLALYNINNQLPVRIPMFYIICFEVACIIIIDNCFLCIVIAGMQNWANFC